MRILSVPGFLGEASDWIPLKAELPKSWTWDCVDLLSLAKSATSLADVPKRLCQIYPGLLGGPHQYDIWIGYSLGARLLMEVLSQHPKRSPVSLPRMVVLISMNHGWGEEREPRLKRDREWSQKFEVDFKKTLAEWNQQSIFSGSSEPNREGQALHADTWAQIMEAWSIGHQQNLDPVLNSNREKVVLMYGALDAKYSSPEQKNNFFSYAEKSGLQVLWLKNAGHRALFDDPKELAQKLLKSVLSR